MGLVILANYSKISIVVAIVPLKFLVRDVLHLHVAWLVAIVGHVESLSIFERGHLALDVLLLMLLLLKQARVDRYCLLLLLHGLVQKGGRVQIHRILIHFLVGILELNVFQHVHI